MIKKYKKYINEQNSLAQRKALEYDLDDILIELKDEGYDFYVEILKKSIRVIIFSKGKAISNKSFLLTKDIEYYILRIDDYLRNKGWNDNKSTIIKGSLKHINTSHSKELSEFLKITRNSINYIPFSRIEIEYKK